MYVSNYQMYGGSFTNPGFDECPGTSYDPSFVYKISVASLRIVDVIKVGSVPKYLAVSPDGKFLIVSDWCSAAVSVVSLASGREVHRIPVGSYPRGIAITQDSRIAYIAVMGSNLVAALDLRTFAVHDIVVGAESTAPGALAQRRYLYITLNASGEVAKLNLRSGHEITAHTGSYTRSLTISADGRSLYVVNYESSTIAKLRADNLGVRADTAHGRLSDRYHLRRCHPPAVGVVLLGLDHGVCRPADARLAGAYSSAACQQYQATTDR